MRLLEQNPKTGEMKVLVTNPDDLWHLYNIILLGDIVSASTYRREEAREDAIRAEREKKVRVFISLSVERCEFMEFQNTLRVSGRIIDAPFDTGSFHTLNVTEGTDIVIRKEVWPSHILHRIREAVAGKGNAKIIAVAVEYGEATVALLKSFGVEEVATIQSTSMKESPGKKEKSDFFSQILEQVRAMPRLPVIVVGPGFIKDDFVREAKSVEPEIFTNAQLIHTGQGGMAGIREAMSKPENAKLLEDVRMAEEARVVEGLKEQIARDGPCTYGMNEVAAALEAGAVELLIVSDRLLREGNVNDMMKRAEEKAANVFIVTSRWEPGKQIESLGGIAAILRYRLSR